MQPRPNPTGLMLKQPVAFFKKQLKVDFKKALVASAKGLFKGAVGNLEGATGEAVDLATAFGLAKSKEERAYLLVFRGLAAAVNRCWQEAYRLKGEPWDAAFLAEQGDKLDAWLAGQQIVLFMDFFQAPHRIKVVGEVRDYLKEELAAFGLEEKQSLELQESFGMDFKDEVHAEYNGNREYYELVHKHFTEDAFKDAYSGEQNFFRFKDYQEIMEQIKELEEDLEDIPQEKVNRRLKKSEKLNAWQEKKEKFERNVIELAETLNPGIFGP
jgi:hypothetical protein